VTSALVRTEKHADATASKLVRNLYVIKVGMFKGAVKRRRKGKNKTTIRREIVYRGGSLSLIRFSVNPSTLGTRQKMYAKIKKGRRKRIRTGFMKKISNKTDGKTIQAIPFYRPENTRYPIAPFKSLSIPQMITNAEVTDALVKDVGDYFSKRIMHELEHRRK
jgi:hypothetical protein